MSEAATQHKPLAALIAEAQGFVGARKFEQAVAVLASILQEQPNSVDACALMGSALRELGRFDQAEGHYLRVLKGDPGHPGALVGWAWVAHQRGEWSEAASRWARVRSLHPALTDGYFGGGAALQHLGRLEEAERVYRLCFWQARAHPHLLEGFARLAELRDDGREAARRWSALMTLFPDDVRGHLGAAQSLARSGDFEGADTAFRQALVRFPRDLSLLTHFAKCAEQAGRWEDALKRWDAVASEFHSHAEGYLGAFDVLQKLGRLEDALNALIPAVRMFPASLEVARRYAWLAHYRADYEEAGRRWAGVRQKFPEQPVGYVGGVASLRAAAAYAEAEALAEEGLRKFPNDAWIATEYALIAMSRHDWALASQRFHKAHERHPGEQGLVCGYADALVAARQFDEADRLIAKARATQGDNLTLSCAFANIATRRRDWPESAARWRAAVEQFPGGLQARLGLAGSLCGAGDFDASEQVLHTARALFPGALEVERELARTLSQKRDWANALPLWASLKAKYPSHGGVREGITQALWQARQDLAGSDARLSIPEILLQPDAAQSADAKKMFALFMKFESIGDTCEFGIVQRRFGAEPLSLLRWASTRPEVLAEALDDRLRGVGDPENTVVSVSNGEYTTRDKRYHMFSHTFTPETAAPYEKFFAQQCKRIKFLRDKLLDDLIAPEKIFVYKCDYGLSDAQAIGVMTALRRYGGKPWLLCMRLVDEQHVVGDLETIEDNLYVGYTDRFSTIDINVANWVSVCGKVAQMWKP